MADPLTANKSLAQPTRGGDTGTWDTPMNANFGIIDNSFGGVAALALSNSPVTLSSAQYQCSFIKLTGALTANVPLTFPGGIGSFFTIINQTTNSSNFVVTMATTAAGSQTVGLPPGQNTKVMIDGTNPQFEALPHHVGGYWDHAGSSVPLWVSICTVPPYLHCDGSGFSAGTYPALAALLGGTTLPDARGRIRMALDEGTGRLTNISAGVGQSGGEQNHTLNTGEMPIHNHGINDPGHVHAQNSLTVYQTGAASFALGPVSINTAALNTQSAATGITIQNAGSGGGHNNIQPAYFGGITLVRAG